MITMQNATLMMFNSTASRMAKISLVWILASDGSLLAFSIVEDVEKAQPMFAVVLRIKFKVMEF